MKWKKYKYHTTLIMCQVTLTGIYDQKLWRTSLQLENVTIDIKYGLKAKKYLTVLIKNLNENKTLMKYLIAFDMCNCLSKN